jgi:hypothetical protein
MKSTKPVLEKSYQLGKDSAGKEQAKNISLASEKTKSKV